MFERSIAEGFLPEHETQFCAYGGPQSNKKNCWNYCRWNWQVNILHHTFRKNEVKSGYMLHIDKKIEVQR